MNFMQKLGFSFVTMLLALSSTAYSTTVTNLSSDKVSIAKFVYQPYSQNDLGIISLEGFTFIGWYNLDPGETHDTSPGWMYVRRGGDDVTWAGVDTAQGIVKYGSKFSEFLTKSNYQKELRNALDNGFEKVEFMKLEDGQYNINGDREYEIAPTKVFNFDDESRSIKFVKGHFKVPGQIIDYKISANDHGANINWKEDRKGGVMSYTGSIEGKQSTPFGSRDKGYYSGSITIRYTRKR